MNKEMSETLTRVGPGTRMGKLLRRYWVPALMSSEIAEPDSPQVRVQLLGEKLRTYKAQTWLINTGWSGGGCTGTTRSSGAGDGAAKGEDEGADQVEGFLDRHLDRHRGGSRSGRRN